MSVADKMQVIKHVWASLQESPNQVPSPQWHADVLAARRKRLESAKATVCDWQEAKESLNRLGNSSPNL
ncbi:addiction module protein [Neorhodopirellula lusitana]|uniref:addiction module protein n=1 Tax=Neorhodopirellula lusitana TaxID=445327 RepID=UPI00384ECDF3